MTVHQLLRERLHEKAGLLETPKSTLSYSDLVQSEWSPKFEQLMRNRLIMGALRYGRLGAVNKPKYDRIKSIRKRLDSYDTTHNLELLVDIANLCLLEFVEPYHPDCHFSADDTQQYQVSKV